MKRREYEEKLKAWEADGYDVSELREKWFPAKKSHATTWLSILTVILIIVIVTIVVWQAPSTQMPVLFQETIAIGGRVILENEKSYEAVEVGLWSIEEIKMIDFAYTDIKGEYKFNSVPIPQINNPTSYYQIDPKAVGFAHSTMTLQRDEIGFSANMKDEIVNIPVVNSVLRMPDIILPKPKQIVIKWVYQPDSTIIFSGPALKTGTAILISSYVTNDNYGMVLWSNGKILTPMRLSPQGGFIFSAEQTTRNNADLFFSHTYNYPMSLWADNDLRGGIHDMGDVPLEEITSAPEKAIGVGPFEYYNNQNTGAIVGHTYLVLTSDGTHYAKFRVVEISKAQVQ